MEPALALDTHTAVLNAFERALRRETHNLVHSPGRIWQQAYNRLRWTDADVRSALQAELEVRSRPGTMPWLRPLRPASESNALIMTLAGHTDSVNACAVNRDGSWIVSASGDGTLRVWDCASGAERATLTGHADGVNACAVSADGTWIVSASNDGTLRTWDVDSWRQRLTLSGHTGWITDCAVSPDGTYLVSTGWDGTVKIWDPDSREARATLTDHGDSVHACATSPDGTWFVSASGNAIRIWDAATAECRAAVDLTGKAGWVWDCAVTPDGSGVVTASKTNPDEWVTDNSLAVWSAATGDRVAYLVNHDVALNACAVGPDGTVLVVAGAGGTLELWNLRAGERFASLLGHAAGVSDCVMTPDGRWVVSAGRDRTLKVWEVSAAAEADNGTGHSTAVNACAVSPDGHLIASASWDRTVKLWDSASGIERATLRGHKQQVTACSFSPDGKWIISASGGDEPWDFDQPPDDTLRVWGVASRCERSAFDTKLSGWVRGCAVSPDGTLVVTGATDDATMKVRVAATGAERRAVTAHADGILDCAVSPDATFAVSAGADGTLAIWEFPKVRLRATLSGHGAPVAGCAVSPNAGWIVSVSGDGPMRLWESARGTERGAPLGRGGYAACAVSPDGRLIATVGGDTHELLEVWDEATRSQLASIPLLGDARCVAFHPWRPFVVTGDASGAVTMLDIVRVDYGPLIVTAVDGRTGPKVRCPRCLKRLAVRHHLLGETIRCPTRACGQYLQLNSRIVPRPMERQVSLRFIRMRAAFRNLRRAIDELR
jgi:WD40 repeat protein